MVQAKWNGAIIADAKEYSIEIVEGNTYFPPASVKQEYLKPIEKTTVCPWKGTCNYFDITVDGKTNPGAAWVYKEPKEKAKNIKGYIAFWNGVQVGKLD